MGVGMTHSLDPAAILYGRERSSDSKRTVRSYRQYDDETGATYWAMDPCIDYESALTEGRLHREGGPAELWDDGSYGWWRLGQQHRVGGPAVHLYDDLDEHWWDEWFVDGQLHREDGPAQTCDTGPHLWFRHDQLHREDGPAVIQPDGSTLWCVDDRLHRGNDLPAFVAADGSKGWWVDGEKHREGGLPACIEIRPPSPAEDTSAISLAWSRRGERQLQLRIRSDGSIALDDDLTAAPDRVRERLSALDLRLPPVEEFPLLCCLS